MIQQSKQMLNDYIIKNVKIIDVNSKELMDGAAVRIVDGVIAERYTAHVPARTEVFDAQGAYMLPGLIDMHVHLVWDGSPDPLGTMHKEGANMAMIRGISNARQSLLQGVTTIRDVGSIDDVAIDIAKAFESNMIFGPTVVAAGRIIQPTGGHVPEMGCIADSHDELVKAVRQLKARGAGVIKVASTGGAYGPEEIGPSVYSQQDLEIIVAEAHKLGLKVASHSLGKVGITNAVYAGIDTIEHGANIPEEVLKVMKDKGTYLIPTLAIYKKLSESSGQIPELYVKKSQTVVDWHKETLRRALALGIPIALGTDAGSPNFGPHPSVYVEMLTMVEYGMHPIDVMVAATKSAATALGKEHSIGSVEPGKKADLILVKDNPLEDISALRTMYKVIKDGMIL